MKDVNKPIIGRYVKQSGGYKAFAPFSFPPEELLEVSPSLYKTHEEATRLIGKLDGITRLLPDKDFFLLMFVKKDATYSSQIEGTQATMQDAVVAPVSDDGYIQMKHAAKTLETTRRCIVLRFSKSPKSAYAGMVSVSAKPN